MYGPADQGAESFAVLRTRPRYGPRPRYEVAHAGHGRAIAAQMDAVTSARDCHVHAIVDDNTCARSTGGGRHGPCHVSQQPSRQIAFPKLNEIDAGGDRLFEPVDQR